MKKITLIFAAILLMGTVLFFACKKDTPAPVEDNCAVTITNAAVAFKTKVNAYKAKVVANPTSYTNADCTALKTEGLNLLASAKACPELAANTTLIAGFQAQADAVICP